MLENLMKALEEGNVERDGSVTRDEFDTVDISDDIVTPGDREEMMDFLEGAIPSALKFIDSQGRTVITFYDDRGRAASAPMEDLDDEELLRIALARGYERVGVPNFQAEEEVGEIL